MFGVFATVLISVILAAAIATVFVDHDSTNEIVNWDGQRSTL